MNCLFKKCQGKTEKKYSINGQKPLEKVHKPLLNFSLIILLLIIKTPTAFEHLRLLKKTLQSYQYLNILQIIFCILQIFKVKVQCMIKKFAHLILWPMPLICHKYISHPINQQAMRLILRTVCPFTRFKVPYSINLEEQAGYLKKVQRAEVTVTQSQKQQLVPRRKRKIYDRPRIDRNIEGYGAWRVFEEEELIYKHNENNMEVCRKIMIQPKWLVHAFGIGALPISNPRSSHREYYFQDNRLNTYLLYEYRNTTHYKPNKEGYDYENQEHIRPRERIVKRLAPQQFWQSQQKFQFRLNATIYAQKFKFEEWLLKQIEARKTQKSYDQYIDQKYGKVFSFNLKQQASKFQPCTPMVSNVTPEHFNPPKKGKQPEVKVKLGSVMEQKYRIKDRLTQIRDDEKKKEEVAGK